ncbi:unnamed protein product, partial [Mesorhabditis spiculigera]
MSDLNSIVDTEITWDMVEHDIQLQYKTSAKTGPKRSAVHLGDHNGYISKCALITFDWTNDQEKLPRQGIVKIVFKDKNTTAMRYLMAPHDDAALQAGILNDTELQVFQAMTDLGKTPEIPLPRFVSGRPYGVDGLSAGYLIVEKIDDFHNVHIYEDLEESSALAGVKVLAEMTVFSLNNPEAVRKLAENQTFEINFGDFASRAKIERGIGAMAEKYKDKYEEIQSLKAVTHCFDTIEKLGETMTKNIRALLLVHGDMWPGNILWSKGADGNLDVKLVVDWQLAHIGNPCEDLVRFLAKGLSGKEYAARRDFYLKAFYDQVAAGVNKAVLPWKDLNEFIAEYERIFPIIFLIWLPPFILLVTDEQIRGKGPNAEQRLLNFRAKFRGMVDEAVRCMKRRY